MLCYCNILYLQYVRSVLRAYLSQCLEMQAENNAVHSPLIDNVCMPWIRVINNGSDSGGCSALNMITFHAWICGPMVRTARHGNHSQRFFRDRQNCIEEQYNKKFGGFWESTTCEPFDTDIIANEVQNYTTSIPHWYCSLKFGIESCVQIWSLLTYKSYYH